MEHLRIRESVVNCPICRNSGVRRQTYFSKYFTKEFSRGMYHFWQHKHMPVSPVSSLENFIKNQKTIQKCTSSRDGYEQIYRKSLMASAKKSNYKLKKHHSKKPAVIYQVYTLTTDNNKPKKKPSRTVYSYPYSSSSSETSTSLIGKRKKSITMHPSTKKGSDDEDTDSEFNTCKNFPITEKHYRHIVDGVECPSIHNRPSFSRKKPKEETKIKKKITKRADFDLNQMNLKQSNGGNAHACHLKTRKKCKCKSKCKHELDEDRSDSVLSEKTFAKFINSLHTYVNKTKKLSSHKCQKKRIDTDSSCSLCQHEETLMRKKKLCNDHDCKKHHHHHHHHHQQHARRSRLETEDIFKKYLQKF